MVPKRLVLLLPKADLAEAAAQGRRPPAASEAIIHVATGVEVFLLGRKTGKTCDFCLQSLSLQMCSLFALFFANSDLFSFLYVSFW